MVKAGHVLNKLSCELGLDSAIKLGTIQSKWQAIFDNNLTLHMYPYDLRDNRLLVYVDSPVWLRELTYLKKEVLSKLSDFLLKDITFKIGKVVRNKRSNSSTLNKAPLDSEIPIQQTPLWVSEEIQKVKDEELRKILLCIINNMHPAEKE